MQKPIEKHHISHKPEVTVTIPLELHHEIHGTTPNKSELSILMRQYDKLTKLSVMIKNWSGAFKKEFGDTLVVDLTQIESERHKILGIMESLIKTDLRRVDHIQGLGLRYLAGILAHAHPNRFSSLRKFLFYCGYTAASQKLKHYSRRIKPIMHQIVKSMIMHKDKKYYSLYLKIKEDLRQKYPDFPKIRTHKMAMNRTGTFLLKELYAIFHGQKDLGGLDRGSTCGVPQGLGYSSTPKPAIHRNYQKLNR